MRSSPWDESQPTYDVISLNLTWKVLSSNLQSVFVLIPLTLHTQEFNMICFDLNVSFLVGAIYIFLVSVEFENFLVGFNLLNHLVLHRHFSLGCQVSIPLDFLDWRLTFGLHRQTGDSHALKLASPEFVNLLTCFHYLIEKLCYSCVIHSNLFV